MSFAVPFATESITLSTDRVSPEDAERQERTAQEILWRLAEQPGLILADEVGMGKTFVALAVAASVALARPDDGPIVVMVPPSLKHKWPRDWDVFREHCLRGGPQKTLRADSADSGVAFLRLLDDPPASRKAIIFLTHGALNRSLTDEWVKLALIRRALARRTSMEHVRRALPRFAGRLLRSQWVDRHASDLWERLLDRPPHQWHRIMKSALAEKAPEDDPVPTALVDAMDGLDLEPVLEALESLPLRESIYVDDRLQRARHALSAALGDLWKAWQRKARLHSPLLVFDEAHHLKNMTRLSSLFAEDGAMEDSEAVSGPLAGVFSRMLFLTATPFQLGHRELISVLRRFTGMAWDSPDAPPSGKEPFTQALDTLEEILNEAQAAALRLERAWGRLRPAHLRAGDGSPMPPDAWWQLLRAAPPPDGLAAEVQARYQLCHAKMREAEALLRPWVIRHLKPRTLPRGSEVVPPKRREVLIGASIRENAPLPGDPGLEVDGEALLPFLLAARAQVALATRAAEGIHKRALFAEGLASSYEAYLETRQGRADTDDEDGADDPHAGAEDPEITWYLSHLDRVLPQQDEEVKGRHPKVFATIDRALRLWWLGEKTLIFCHYRATGRALRAYLSRRLESQLLDRAAQLLKTTDHDDAQRKLADLADRFFDTDGRLRNETLALLGKLVAQYPELDGPTQQRVVEVVLRFLRTPSFLVRYFPIDHNDPVQALTLAFDRPDVSGLAFRSRVDEFCRFLAKRCVTSEREEYLAALEDIQTGTFRRESPDPDDPDVIRYLPNVRLANGLVRSETRRRLMLAFNTPFFPEILIASSVLAEGVDLHLDCRFVVHHDLSWNPSTIEQRTGRVDRIGSKAEKARRPIHVYLPFVTATQDEKMFRVVRDRERWFSVVMGEKYQLDEGTTEKLSERIPFPEQAARELAFDLSIRQTPDEGRGLDDHGRPMC